MKNKNSNENYLDKIPKISAKISWTEEDNIVTIAIENKGFFNKVAKRLFKKPKISYIHLDEFGSFVFKQIDGKKDITEIGALVKENFGDKAEPLYERLSKYISILNSYGFVIFY